jgi:hypothetical protein
MALFISPFTRAPDANNNALSGAKLYFYVTGTTTPASVLDAPGGTPLGSVVTADGSGKFPSIYLDPTITYRVVLKSAAGVTLFPDADPYNATLSLSSEIRDTPPGDDAVTETVADALARLPIDPRQFGAVLDGVTDDGPALRKCFAAMAATNRPLHIPAGMTMLVEDTTISSLADAYVPPENALIYGDGPSSAIKFRRNAYGSFFGFSVENDNLNIRDLTIVVDPVGGIWVAAAQVNAHVTGVHFTNVAFEGAANGNLTEQSYGLAFSSYDTNDVSFERCRFDTMTFGLLKNTYDYSTQTGIEANDCVATNCVEVFEFNSPGALDAGATNGSPTITGLTTDQTAVLRVGQEITSPALPLGTTITAVGSTTLTLSANATATGTKRFSVGWMQKIRVRNLRATGVGQWGVGLAHCRDFEVDVVVDDCGRAAVHIEDCCENGKVTATTRLTNKLDGQVGSPSSESGAVEIISGSKDIHVDCRDVDLRDNTTGSANGVYAQDGVAGSTNEVEECSNISIGGRIRLKAKGATASRRAVVAYNCDIGFDDLEILNEAATPASPVISLFTCDMSGRLSFTDPGIPFETDDAAKGRLDRIEFFSTASASSASPFASMTAFVTGPFGVARNYPPLSAQTVFRFRSTADGSAIWRTLCPAPNFLIAKLFRRYVGSALDYEIGTIDIRNGVLTPTDVIEVDGAEILLTVNSTVAVATTADTTSGSPTLTSIGSLTGVGIGCPVSGTGIPAGTRVLSLESATSVKLDHLATASGTGVAVTFTPSLQTDDGWRMDSGHLQFRAYNPGNVQADVLISFDGLLVPAVA